MPPTRSLKPTTELPAPKQLIDRVSARIWLLRNEGESHPAYGMSPTQWQKAINKRIKLLRSNAPDIERDQALVELCKLDPRYFATDLVIAKILDWKLRIIWADIQVPGVTKSPGSRQLVADAKRNLGELKKAISFTTGKGQKGYRLRAHVRDSFAFYSEVFENIRKELRASFTTSLVRKLAARWDLPEATVRALKNARQLEGIVDAHLASEYRISASRIRTLRSL